MTTQSHHDHVEKQFSSQASEYLTSTVHASGQDLQRLAVRLADYPDASVLDMGCGAGHASFVAAQNVSTVVAYDLSAHMLDVVAQAAEARQLKNITTRQGYVESLPFADNAFDIVISRYSAHHWHDVGAALREPGIETRWSADCDGRNVSGSPSARHLVTDGRSITRYISHTEPRQR